MAVFRVVKSVVKSVGKGVRQDPEVQRLASRHPRVFHFVRRRITPDEKFGLHLTVGALVALLFVYFFFSVVTDLIGQEPLIQSDLRIINLVQLFRMPSVNHAMLLVTYLGKWQVVLAAMMVGGFVFVVNKRWHYLIAMAASVTFSELFIWLAKNLFDRPRPPLVNALAPETSFSFPSGHSFVAFSFYGLLAYFWFRAAARRWQKVLAIVLGIITIIAIGSSRIYLGAHWPSDVLAGYASGAAWLTILITVLEIRHRFNSRDRGAPYLKKSTVTVITLVLTALWGGYLGYYYQTHPLRPQTETVEPQVTITRRDIPQNLFLHLPRASETITGTPMEPINIIVVGSQEELTRAFTAAEWFPTDPITVPNVWRLLVASLFNDPYLQAPGTPSFWDTRPNDFAFEQPTEMQSARERHHIHFWRTPFSLGGDLRVWFGTAHFDRTIKMTAYGVFPTHTIDPAVDKERERIKEALLKTNFIASWEEFQIVEPKLGSNQSGDLFFTDGKADIFYLSR